MLLSYPFVPRGGAYSVPPFRGLWYLVACSGSPDSHGEHIKCSPARAELAIDFMCRHAAGANAGPRLSKKRSARSAPTADIWGLIFSTSQGILLVEEIFWHVVAVA